MSAFPRVLCVLCERLCLPEHAPTHSIVDLEASPRVMDARGRPTGPLIKGEEITLLVPLCRVPAVRLHDGGYGFTGCGPDNSVTALRARVLADPYLSSRALPPIF